MKQTAPQLEPMRSETFPYPDQYASGISPLGPICYFDTGQPAAKSAPTIVLVHALGLNMTLWEHVAPALAPHMRVIGLDLPGCGHSARPRHRYSLALATQALIGLLDHLGVDQAVLLGHSFGGRVVTDLALRYPQRAAGLVLMNSAGFVNYGPLYYAAARLLFRPVVIAPLIQLTVNHVLGQIFCTKNRYTQAFMDRVLGRRKGQSHYAWDFAHYASPLIDDMMSSVLPRLGELTLPTLVIWGAQDALLPYKDVPSWVARLPRATLVTIPNCGHMPNLEHPEVVSREVNEFVRVLSQRASPQSAHAV